MRIGSSICFLIALGLIGVGVVNWWQGQAQSGLGEPIGMFLAAGLLIILGLWLFQQPRRYDQKSDESQ